MAAVTLDAGVLIAAERGSSSARAVVASSVEDDMDLVVSAATVAEVWRGGSRGAGIAWLISTCQVEPVDSPLARRAGELLGEAGSQETLDAILVATAERHRAPVVTADLGHVAPLADAAGVEVRAF